MTHSTTSGKRHSGISQSPLYRIKGFSALRQDRKCVELTAKAQVDALRTGLVNECNWEVSPTITRRRRVWAVL
jgi:hypothetical protein